MRQFVPFCERVGVHDPQTVKVRHIEAYQSWLRHERHASTATVAQRKHVLSSFWRFLRHQEMVTTNPPGDGFSPRIAHRIPDFLTLTEQHTALTVLAAQATRPLPVQAFAAVATGPLTGLRVSE